MCENRSRKGLKWVKVIDLACKGMLSGDMLQGGLFVTTASLCRVKQASVSDA